MNVLDLFSGIGGFSLGLERAGMRTIAFCETDEYCRKVLNKHWPDVPIYGDIKELKGDGISADLVCGGFPCQRFSTASAGRRIAEDLWPEFDRIIGEVRPRYIIAENVQEVPITQAEYYFRERGYGAMRLRIGADDCGADHTRHRWWACAYPNDKGQLCGAIHAEVAKLPALCRSLWGASNYSRAIRVPNGLPNRVDRMHALGNAVVPQVVEVIGRAIMEAERQAA